MNRVTTYCQTGFLSESVLITTNFINAHYIVPVSILGNLESFALRPSGPYGLIYSGNCDCNQMPCDIHIVAPRTTNAFTDSPRSWVKRSNKSRNKLQSTIIAFCVFDIFFINARIFNYVRARHSSASIRFDFRFSPFTKTYCRKHTLRNTSLHDKSDGQVRDINFYQIHKNLRNREHGASTFFPVIFVPCNNYRVFVTF